MDIDLRLSRDFLEVVEVVDRLDTLETREAEDFRDEIDIVSSFKPGFRSVISNTLKVLNLNQTWKSKIKLSSKTTDPDDHWISSYYQSWIQLRQKFPYHPDFERLCDDHAIKS